MSISMYLRPGILVVILRRTTMMMLILKMLNIFCMKHLIHCKICMMLCSRKGLLRDLEFMTAFFIRSWYIHHLHSPQCFQFRILEINRHWRFWHQEIVGAWRDRIHPDDQVIYDVVHPDPPRPDSIHDITLDIVLSQGLEAPRRAGLVTVLRRDDRAQRAAFAVAVSLSEHTSGHQIVQAAEYLHECNLHHCAIRHGWDGIPFTMEPVHEMQDGDSFIVAVTSQSLATAANTFHDAAPHNDVPTSGNQSHDFEDPPNHVDHDLPDDVPDSPVPSLSVVNDPPGLHGVHIHRFGHQQVFGHLRWDSAEHVLLDAALRVGRPVREFSAFHRLLARPDDLIDNEDAIILQHTHDVQYGSTEKLILVDVELHVSASTNTFPQAPPVSRRVYKVVPFIVRRHLLHLTHTAAYCDWNPRPCIVFCNRIPWPAQDLGPKQIHHGMYLRIVVPPPPNPHWEISRAVQLFHESREFFTEDEANAVAVHLLSVNSDQRPADIASEQGSVTRTLASVTGWSFKSADLDGDIDIPVTSTEPNVPLRRLRPVHDGTDQWLLELGQIFSDAAEEEAIAGEAFLYVQTWFIDHQRHVTCRRPRPVRLDSHSVAWIDDFRHEWRDMLDPDVFFSIHFVKPRPPQYRHYNYACHVLLEQNRHHGQAAGIITALMSGFTHDGILQGAFSTNRFLRKADLIDLLEVEPFCSGRRCTAYHDLEPVHAILATEVTSGYSIRLHIDPINMQLPVLPEGQGYFDDISFMQISPTCALDVPSGSQESSSFTGPFVFNPNAAAFQPGQVVTAQSEFVQDLYALWQQHAFSWEDETASAKILTWFLAEVEFS